MINDDKERPFEEVFYNCMWDAIREANVYLNLQQSEKFQMTCRKAGARLERKIMQIAGERCKALQETTKKGFRMVAEDIKELQEKDEMIKGEIDDLQQQLCKEEEEPTLEVSEEE